MSNRKLVQHRAQRDTANREFAELKKENEQLKRQLTRLRKKLSQENEESSSDIETEEETPRAVCPICQSHALTCITTPSGKLRYACRNCRKWRGNEPAML